MLPVGGMGHLHTVILLPIKINNAIKHNVMNFFFSDIVS